MLLALIYEFFAVTKLKSMTKQHRASINFIEVYAYQKCLLLIQSRVVDNSKLLRKKWSDFDEN